MKAIDIGLIQARRTKLTTDIAAHREAISSLEAKLSELEIAERVFAELALEIGDNETSAKVSFDDLIRDANRTAVEQRAKPAGLPTVPEMIVEALHHAHSLGASGLEPSGIVSFIRGRYWPTAPSEKVTPIVWRMWKKDGKLEKHDSLYALPLCERPDTNESLPTKEAPPSDDGDGHVSRAAPKSATAFDALMLGTSSIALGYSGEFKGAAP